MKTTYNNVEITYSEGTNKWLFELRGRSRSADSLAKAKEAIDKPVPKEEEKPFQPIKIFLTKYRGEPVEALVTSIAEGRSYSGKPCVWVKRDGQRTKEDVGDCIQHNAETEKQVALYVSLGKEAAQIQERMVEILRSMPRITVP